ncbi:hypothetical protein P0W64_13005 [Tsukamurella sp. 8F]|uniref:hypothetical protein n=1 Tax=unclassified Tsukamurella TaxID=2633480 RepID=UPI0023B8EB7F|nr:MULTISPECIES: hypothetical protein [unclassified Tsukamurella]MDF0530485.1 hypothetical protein [Tsukamurella sp. 8J]MDF0587694.1 hypothetical protein [Tsukamurella sp. 8F]
MTATATGWLPAPETGGGPRYRDGHRWSTTTRPPLSDAERAHRLAAAVAWESAHGATVGWITPHLVELDRRSLADRAVYALLGFFGLVGWMVRQSLRTDKHCYLWVDEAGRFRRDRI